MGPYHLKQNTTKCENSLDLMIKATYLTAKDNEGTFVLTKN